MSIVKTWGYGTNTASAKDVTVSSINPVYLGIDEDTQEEFAVIQKQAPDNCERIAYQCKPVGNVGTELKSVHPLKVKNGVQYTVRLDEQLKLTSSDDPTYAETVPVVAMLVIRHPLNGNLEDSDIETVVKRLVGACYKTVDGTTSTRFGDLMAGCCKPSVNGVPAPTP